MGVKVTFEFENALELEAFLSQFRRTAGATPRQARSVFRESDLPGLQALADCGEGLRTQEFARKLGVGAHRLPPIVNGWNRRARVNGVSLDDLLVREPVNEGGRPASVYRLTERGKEFVRRESVSRKGV